MSTSVIGSTVFIPTRPELDKYNFASPEPVISPLVLSSGSKVNPIEDYHLLRNVRGGYINTNENESVICKSCISKKVRLKGNYIIIKWKEIKWTIHQV